VAPLLWSLPVIFSTPQFISTNAHPHTNHLTLRCRSNVIVSSRSSKGRGLETYLDTERVRFLRAGLVTLLPGGLGIDPAGTMTGARGASLWVRSMVRVTPASSRSHETRPGLSRGINLRGKCR
jgi:hypothetical protein